jgi:hypothetical protein
MRSHGVLSLAVVTMLGCLEAPQVGILGAPPRPSSGGAHVHFDTTMELPSDAEVLEPSQPFVASPEERLLAHVHTPTGVCSGVVVGSHLIATAHQCMQAARGIGPVTGQVHIEIASSSLTWAQRTPTKIVTPDCGWEVLDLAVFVVAEPIDWVKAAPLGTVPGPGAKVQAYGFGHCEGERHGIRDKAAGIVTVDSQAFVIDVGLCKGDVGGFVADGGGSFLGIISHQDDPDDSPRHTTTIFRADTTAARELFAQAQAVADGADATKQKPVSCQ